ncbi:MAG: DUF6745 domain-containing protein, partial [Streptosporangiaceae bacterium]
ASAVRVRASVLRTGIPGGGPIPLEERTILAAYEAAGLAAPDHVLWVDSPSAGAAASVLLRGGGQHPGPARKIFDRLFAHAPHQPPFRGLDAGASVRDAVRTRPWEAARAAAHAELGPQEWARAWARTGGGLWDQVDNLVVRIRRGIGERDPELRAATLDAVLGQHDAPWLALFASLGRPLTGLSEVARAAGWWWPYERVVIVSERPAELHRDEPGRLHRGDGPALGYPDGFALHAWRGMPIPADFVGTLKELTAQRILDESNAELRRVMLEYFGYDRYLAEIGARPLHQDATGVLWRIDLPGDEPIVMVEVVNSTAEPDGTFRTYYLRVPPDTRTARAGVAWTFGVEEAGYLPEKET